MCLASCAAALSSCASTPPTGPACPSLPEYTPELQIQAADELDAMPDGSVIANVFMPDYGKMRKGVRACLKAQGEK